MVLHTTEDCRAVVPSSSSPSSSSSSHGCATDGEASTAWECDSRRAALHRGAGHPVDDTDTDGYDHDHDGEESDAGTNDDDFDHEVVSASPAFSLVPQDSSHKLVKSKSFKKRFKGKMLKALKMDDKSIEVRQIRRLSVERVALGDLFESFTIPLKEPMGGVGTCALSGMKEIAEDEVTAEESSETASNPLSESESFTDDDKLESEISAKVLLRSNRMEDDGVSEACGEEHEEEEEDKTSFDTIELSRRKSDSEAILRTQCDRLKSSAANKQARRASTNTIPTCLNHKNGPRRRGSISFDPSVKVIPIPRIKDYPRETRRMMWGCPFDNLYALDVFEATDSES